MQRNPDKWIYTIECANPEGNEDLSRDPHFNIYGWKWSKGYDSVDVIQTCIHCNINLHYFSLEIILL